MPQRSYPSSTAGAVGEPDVEALGAAQSASGLAGTPADPAPIFADDTGQQVKIRAGVRAWVRGRVWEADPATDTGMAVPANASGLPRTDRFVLRLYRSSWNVLATVVTGAPAADPQPPALTQDLTAGVYEIPLARWTVQDGFTSVQAADIVTEAWYPQPSGLIYCTSTSRPYGNARQVGRLIYEYDTGQHRRWDGADWVYPSPTGVLVVTSATRPTGPERVPGLFIHETDTGRTYRWDGTAWAFPRPLGVLICTSTTHPTGPERVPGLVIYETDTNAFLHWSGSAWAAFAAPPTTGNVIVDVFTANPTGGRVNLALNPSLEAAATVYPWTNVGNVSMSVNTNAAKVWIGAKSMVMAPATSGNDTKANNCLAGQCPATAGATYTASAYLLAATTAKQAAVGIVWYDSTRALISTAIGTQVTTSSATWARPSVTATAPANAASMAVQIIVYAATENTYADGVLLENSATLGSYFDGITAGYYWTQGDPAYSPAAAIGTWTKPSNAVSVDVICIGGGGGGGSSSSNTYASGGAGGGGGGYTLVQDIKASSLPDSVSLAVGDGGRGGALSALVGIAGGATYFGASAASAYAYAAGGSGGAGGPGGGTPQSTVSTQGGVGMFKGNLGGNGPSGVGGNALGGAGGGGGGGNESGSAGGNGGYPPWAYRTAAPGAPGRTSTKPATPAAVPPGTPGRGGGGGGGMDTAIGTLDPTGGDGGLYGGGGGGGGGGFNTSPAGAGGAGAAGCLVVITHI